MARSASNELRGAFFALAKATFEGRLEFDDCFVAESFDPSQTEFYAERPEVAEKRSASATMLAFAQIVAQTASGTERRGRVAIKIWLEHKDGSVYRGIKGLEYEIAVYRRILKKVLAPGLSTNFVPYIADGRCSRREMLRAMRGSEHARTFGAQFANLVTTWGPQPDIVRMLITQAACNAGACRTLADETGASARSNERNVYCILFTLVWALHVMQKYAGVQHNDLHGHNVMMRDVDPDRPTFAYAPAADEIYVVPREWMPRQAVIFDWDHATVNARDFHQPPNPQLSREECLHYGRCARRNDRYDLYTLLCRARLHGSNTAGAIVVSKLLDRDIAKIDTTENQQRRRRKYMPCLQKDQNVSGWLPTPREMLRSFANLRLEAVARAAPEAIANNVRVFAEPGVDANAVREQIRAVAAAPPPARARQTITTVAVEQPITRQAAAPEKIAVVPPGGFVMAPAGGLETPERERPRQAPARRFMRQTPTGASFAPKPAEPVGLIGRFFRGLGGGGLARPAAEMVV